MLLFIVIFFKGIQPHTDRVKRDQIIGPGHIANNLQ